MVGQLQRSVDRTRFVSAHRRSELDPLHWAPVVEPLVCELIKGDIRVDLNDQPCETPF